jgi:hypothetical protein
MEEIREDGGQAPTPVSSSSKSGSKSIKSSRSSKPLIHHRQLRGQSLSLDAAADRTNVDRLSPALQNELRRSGNGH